MALHEAQIIDIPLVEALEIPKRVDVDGEAIATARDLGINLGDDVKERSK